MDDAVVVGKGMVGGSTMYALGIKNYISKYGGTVTLNDVSSFKYIFICLPTPTIQGKCFTELIEEYVQAIAEAKKDNIIIIRSTVAPGTIRELCGKYAVNIVHIPEFLTEATWKQDAEWPDLVVVGGDDLRSRREVLDIFKSRYKGASFFETDSVTSETIKYAINAFYALKTIYSNQISDFCNKVGVNYETVKKALMARKWVGQTHLTVWHKGGRGAGGKCLGKDLEAFANLSELPLLKLADKLNQELLNKYPKDEQTNPQEKAEDGAEDED